MPIGEAAGRFFCDRFFSDSFWGKQLVTTCFDEPLMTCFETVLMNYDEEFGHLDDQTPQKTNQHVPFTNKVPSFRNAKYNQLLRIEEELGDRAVYVGISVSP